MSIPTSRVLAGASVLLGLCLAACANSAPTLAAATDDIEATATVPAVRSDRPTTKQLTPMPPGMQADTVRDRDTAHRGTPWEILVSGVGVNNEDFDAGSGQLAGSVGYFVTDNFEVALRQSLSFFDVGEGATSNIDGSTLVALDYHFPIDNVLPFIGGSIGGVYGDSVKETFAAGPEAGVKVFVQDDAFIQFAAQWLFLFDDDDSIDNAFEDGQFAYNLGIGLRF